MPNGYMGKILWVNLSDRKIEEREVPAKLYRDGLSGLGLAARTLYDAIPKGADPMGPDNVLGLVSGLLTGTGARMAGRWMAVGKSPLTGGWGDANAGGHFSPAIKRAGYDGIFFTGVADRPVYLQVAGGKAELKDAAELWGLDTVETERRLRELTGIKNLQIACIGPAGEKLSRISGIVTDGARIAARSGLGAVMGSKQLKAVALHGQTPIPVHAPQTIKRLSENFNRWIKQGDRLGKLFTPGVIRFLSRFLRVAPFAFAANADGARTSLRTFGTIITNVISAEIGDSPVKNWMGAGVADFPMATHSTRLAPDRIIAHQVHRYHCNACPTGCGGILNLEGKTRFPLGETHKPEYETCSAFGSLILNNDLDAVFMINDLLNRAGLDTISAGAVVAFAMELYQRGTLTQNDLDGLDLKWGAADATIALLKKIIAREGVGDLLADGQKIAAEKIGPAAKDAAIHAGGQDLPMHDPRMDPGLAVAYAMEPTPGRHTNYSYLFIELFTLHQIYPGLPAAPAFYTKASRLSTKDRELLLSAASKHLALVNGAGVCLFACEYGFKYPLIELLNAATGWGLEPAQYLEIGERIQHLRQAFNFKHGLEPARDFVLPPRVVGEPPLQVGPLKGVTVPFTELNQNFARAMGWDERGRPLQERLVQLGLGDVAAELADA